MFSFLKKINIKVNHNSIRKIIDAILVIYVVENCHDNKIFDDIVKYFAKYYIAYNSLEVIQKLLFK
jgi:hypothetical protein